MRNLGLVEITTTPLDARGALRKIVPTIGFSRIAAACHPGPLTRRTLDLFLCRLYEVMNLALQLLHLAFGDVHTPAPLRPA